MTKCYLCYKITFAISILMVILTISSYFTIDYLLNKQIHKQLLMKPNSSSLLNWMNPPVVIYRKYYLFNVNNPEQVQEGTEIPDLTQLGPYVYREILEKKNLVFTDDDKLTYSPISTLYFEPSLSNGTENDNITFINIPAIALIEESIRNKFQIFWIQSMFNIINVPLFRTKTVSELIVGFQDPLLNMGKFADPEKVKSTKFSLLNDRNGTISHNYTIYLGSDDPAKIGKIHAFNGLTKLTTWSSDNANTLKGSDGIVYPPFLKRNSEFYSFNGEMCRSIKWSYLKDKEIDGAQTYEFHMSKDAFYNSTLNPENEGYCTDDCLGNGVFNLSKCLGGLSMFGSLPHFLNAEEKFIKDVKGLNPQQELHDYLLNLEPNTGAPVRADAKFQLSIYLPSSDLDIVKNVKPVLLPIFWIAVNADVNLETKKLLSGLGHIKRLIPMAHIIMFCIAGLVLVLSLTTIICIHFKQKKIVKGKLYSAVNLNDVNSNNKKIIQ